MGTAYRAKAKVVKVSVGPATGNRIARIVRDGALIPDGVEQDQLDRLFARGLIEKVKVEVVDTDVEDLTADVVVEFDKPPVKSANRATWDAYARHLGLTDAAIADYKKPALMDVLTTPDLLEAALAATVEVEEEEEDPDADGDLDDEGDGDPDPDPGN